MTDTSSSGSDVLYHENIESSALADDATLAAFYNVGRVVLRCVHSRQIDDCVAAIEKSPCGLRYPPTACVIPPGCANRPSERRMPSYLIQGFGALCLAQTHPDYFDYYLRQTEGDDDDVIGMRREILAQFVAPLVVEAIHLGLSLDRIVEPLLRRAARNRLDRWSVKRILYVMCATPRIADALEYAAEWRGEEASRSLWRLVLSEEGVFEQPATMICAVKCAHRLGKSELARGILNECKRRVTKTEWCISFRYGGVGTLYREEIQQMIGYIRECATGNSTALRQEFLRALAAFIRSGCSDVDESDSLEEWLAFLTYTNVDEVGVVRAAIKSQSVAVTRRVLADMFAKIGHVAHECPPVVFACLDEMCRSYTCDALTVSVLKYMRRAWVLAFVDCQQDVASDDEAVAATAARPTIVDRLRWARGDMASPVQWTEELVRGYNDNVQHVRELVPELYDSPMDPRV